MKSLTSDPLPIFPISQRRYVGMLDERDELVAALRGLLSIHDSVTMGQEKELRDFWIPRARVLITNVTGEKS